MNVEIPQETKVKTYSVSRFATYRKCGQAYKYQYVDKQRVKDLSHSNVVGSLVHAVLEEYYTLMKGGQEEHPIEIFKRVYLNAFVEKELYLPEASKKGLWSYAEALGKLYERASSSYKGRDAIRTRSGDIPVQPQATSAWKEAMVQGGIDNRKEFLDSLFPYKHFSVAEAFAEAYSLCCTYKNPVGLSGVEEIEIALSDWDEARKVLVNPIGLGRWGLEGYYLRGYIDLIAHVNGKLTIIDHKTSSGAIKAEDLSHHEQLLSYAWAWQELTGKRVEQVAINDIRASKLIVIALPEHTEVVLENLYSAHEYIEKGLFLKHSPDKYSPCRSWYGGTCPYIGMCWGVS